MASKYIIIKADGFEQPIVFPELMQHTAVAHMMTNGDKERVVSAGFCVVNEDGKYSCYGESWSLGIKSREGDSRVLTRMLT